jgi:hypothetical protein
MNYRLIFSINAIVAALFGLGLLIVPLLILEQFSAETYVSTLYACRFLGGILLVLAWFLWLAKDLDDAQAQRNTAMVLFGSSVGGFVLAIMGMSSIGVLRTNGWILLVAFGIFVLIYGYALFLQPRNESADTGNYRKVV